MMVNYLNITITSVQSSDFRYAGQQIIVTSFIDLSRHHQSNRHVFTRAVDHFKAAFYVVYSITVKITRHSAYPVGCPH